MKIESEQDALLMDNILGSDATIIRAEYNILGLIFMNSYYIHHLVKLSRDHFTQEKSLVIYDAMIHLYNDNKEITLLSLSEKIKLKIKNSVVFLTQLTSYYEQTPFEQNLEILERARKKRAVNKLISEAQCKLLDGNFDIDDISHSIFEDIQKVQAGEAVDDSPQERTRRTLNVIKNTSNKDRHKWQTGLYELDNLLGGIYKGDMTVIAAGSSVGKTALALQIAKKLSANKLKGLFISREMSESRIDFRLAAMITGINSRKIKDNTLDADEMKRIEQALNDLASSTLIINDNISNTNQIRYRLKRGKFDFVMVDYIQIMDSVSKSSNREQQVASISRDLKKLTLDFGVAVIALSQLNQDGNARESQAIFFDSDNYVDISRPTETEWEKIFNKQFGGLDQGLLLAVREQGNDLVKIAVKKQRDGSTGDMIALHCKQSLTFKSLSSEQIMIPVDTNTIEGAIFDE